jgi:hypothetical protein
MLLRRDALVGKGVGLTCVLRGVVARLRPARHDR